MKEKNLKESTIKELCEKLESKIRLTVDEINKLRHGTFDVFIHNADEMPIFNNPFFMNNEDLKEEAASHLIKDIRSGTLISNKDLETISNFVRLSFGLKAKKERKYKVGDIVKMNNPYSKSNYGLIIKVDSDCVLVSNANSCGEYRKAYEISLCTNEEVAHFKFKLKQIGIRISDDGTRLENIKPKLKVGDIVRNCRSVGILTDIRDSKCVILIRVDIKVIDNIDNLDLCSNREKEMFIKELKDDNLMVGKDGVSIVRWIPNFGETFWIISTNDEGGSVFVPKEVERRYLDDIYYPKCFATKELAQQAIDNL